jgi:LmbE family N-acetylglucosaminyl deacetylase
MNEMHKMSYEKVLFLSPHPDDAELGAGGTIARFIEEGREVYYVVFSICRASVPPELPSDIRKEENLRSCEILYISPDKITTLDYEVRTFPTHRQQILDDMIKLKDEIKPDLVLVPSSSDVHQDHNTIYWESLRAFRKEASIWGYEHPWNNLTFTTDIFIRLKEKHVERKLEALRQHKSQSDRSYFKEKYIRSALVCRGVPVGWPYAETFELVRLIL